ncbi:MAG: hypothetical protein IJV35_08820 [Neisseriaceae bacterium]|nr:hypothetical protein [Neisseriaceae bacterium]
MTSSIKISPNGEINLVFRLPEHIFALPLSWIGYPNKLLNAIYSEIASIGFHQISQ